MPISVRAQLIKCRTVWFVGHAAVHGRSRNTRKDVDDWFGFVADVSGTMGKASFQMSQAFSGTLEHTLRGRGKPHTNRHA